jgi:hypothetical protein
MRKVARAHCRSEGAEATHARASGSRLPAPGCRFVSACLLLIATLPSCPISWRSLSGSLLGRPFARHRHPPVKAAATPAATKRIGARRAGVSRSAVVVIDVGKGAVAGVARIARRVPRAAPAPFDSAHAQGALCGFAAVAGHCWPLFLRFPRGKGAATAIGAVLVLGAAGWFTCCAMVGVWWRLGAWSDRVPAMVGLGDDRRRRCLRRGSLASQASGCGRQNAMASFASRDRRSVSRVPRFDMQYRAAWPRGEGISLPYKAAPCCTDCGRAAVTHSL